jgi:hypothetical protein
MEYEIKKIPSKYMGLMKEIGYCLEGLANLAPL